MKKYTSKQVFKKASKTKEFKDAYKKEIKRIYPRNRKERVEECLLDLAYAIESLQDELAVETGRSIYQKVARTLFGIK